MRIQLTTAALLLALPVLLSLKGCETLSTASDAEAKSPHVSASVMRNCAIPVLIPAGASRPTEYRLWAQDREALVDCGALNAAKGRTITALTGQGAE